MLGKSFRILGNDKLKFTKGSFSTRISTLFNSLGFVTKFSIR